MKKKIYNGIFLGADNKASLYDLTIPENWNQKLIVFIHGYMGFKDWGCWNLVERFFTDNQYGFIKYNVSHNGCTCTAPLDFEDLESFSRNTYSKECVDFDSICKIINTELGSIPALYLIGHSRGGGIALLQSKNPFVKKMATWAAISNIGRRLPEGDELQNWKEIHFRYTINGRTKQKMPHHYCQYTDYINNMDRLNIEAHCKTSKIPTLVIHGADDNSVSITEGEEIAQWLQTNLVTIADTEHTFGSSHPWTEQKFPQALEEVCKHTLSFFEE